MVLGAGLVGVACAWLLQRRGHRVLLVDPALAAPADAMLRNGSRAALGVLMGQVAHRGSGRGWRLRQQSLALWRSWRADLARRGYPIAYRPGLLMLAASGNQLEHQQRLALERQRRGLPLELWSRERVAELDPVVPAAALGGLFSPDDGQLDPGQALDALLSTMDSEGYARAPSPSSPTPPTPCASPDPRVRDHRLPPAPLCVCGEGRGVHVSR